MNLYERYILPRLINLAMRNQAAPAERARFVPLATGTVLEIGAGSGLNLPFYGSTVVRLHALDPSRELWRMARRRVEGTAFPVEYVGAAAEPIPLDDGAVDTVVTTWTLCSIPDPGKALAEVGRVLGPGGQLIFVEYGRSPEPRVRVWQDRLTPLWRRVAGGCHLNRAIDRLILEAGFGLGEIERGYAGRPKDDGIPLQGCRAAPRVREGASDADISWVVGLLMAVGVLTGGGHLAAAGQDHAATGDAGRFTRVHALALNAEGRVLWLGAHTGLFRSEDGGRSWQKVPLRPRDEHLDLMAIAPHPGDAQTLYVGTHEAGVLKSTDGGRSWQAVNAGLDGLDVHGLAIDPTTPEKLHAAVRDKGEGLYRTTDGGVKWTRVDDGPGGEVKVLASVNISTGMGGIFLYAGTGAGLQRDPDCF